MSVPHGETDVALEGNILVVTLNGTFNQEGCENGNIKVKRLVEKLNGQPLYMLTDARGFTGGTPSAYLCANDLNKWINQHNLVAKAMVHNKSILMSIAMATMPELRKQNIREFANLEEAYDWLNLLITEKESGK